MIESHDLFHEFPEHKEVIRKMLTNTDFVRMVRDYDDLDGKILRIEQRVDPATDFYAEELKKLRVVLKDKLYQMIVAGA